MSDHIPDPGKKVREDFEAWHEAEKVQPLAPYLDTYKNAHTRCRWEGYQAATQHSAARIAELEAEVQALRRDAERYCWWRDNACRRPSMVAKLLAPTHAPDKIDAAIDAAIEAERGGA